MDRTILKEKALEIAQHNYWEPLLREIESGELSVDNAAEQLNETAWASKRLGCCR